MSYRIQPGDTLSGIAARMNVSLQALEQANPQVKNPDLIYAGEELNIPGKSDGYTPGPPSAPPSAPTAGVPQVDLHRGMSGAEVKSLQDDLVKLGYMTQAQLNTGPGIFGPGPQRALEAFQSAHGVPATGNYGPQTRDALARALGSHPAPPTPPTPTPVDPGPVSGIEDRPGVKGDAQQTIAFFMSKGLTRAQAAGIAGNLLFESGFRPTAVGDGGTSFGVAQWHQGRGDAMKSWTAAHGYSTTSFKGQLEYLWHELNNSEHNALNKLQATTNAYDAGMMFQKYFERPAQINPARGQAAQRFFDGQN